MIDCLVCILQMSDKPQSSEKKRKREFDFSKANQRHVAFKLLYLGWDFHGMAWQDHADNTIEVDFGDWIFIMLRHLNSLQY